MKRSRMHRQLFAQTSPGTVSSVIYNIRLAPSSGSVTCNIMFHLVPFIHTVTNYSVSFCKLGQYYINTSTEGRTLFLPVSVCLLNYTSYEKISTKFLGWVCHGSKPTDQILVVICITIWI